MACSKPGKLREPAYSRSFELAYMKFVGSFNEQARSAKFIFTSFGHFHFQENQLRMFIHDQSDAHVRCTQTLDLISRLLLSTSFGFKQ